MVMSLYDGVKFSMYETKNTFHLKVGGVGFYCPPGFDGGIEIGVIWVVEYPKKFGETFDSWNRDDFK